MSTSSHLIGRRAEGCPHIRAETGGAAVNEGGEDDNKVCDIVDYLSEWKHCSLFPSVSQLPAPFLHTKTCHVMMKFIIVCIKNRGQFDNTHTKIEQHKADKMRTCCSSKTETVKLKNDLMPNLFLLLQRINRITRKIIIEIIEFRFL